VDLTPIFEFMQNSALSEYLRTSLKAMPIVEAIHVMAVATVFGTIVLVDLRLLGYPNVQRSFSKLHRELLQWTWIAFGVAVVTGVLLLIVNAITYQRNTAFWLKMTAMGLAGINMLVFELVTAKSVAKWDKGMLPPISARTAGALSIVLWISVIVFGRWIGFTKGYDFSIPEDVQLDFSFPPE
jgi:hypothetical protein